VNLACYTKCYHVKVAILQGMLLIRKWLYGNELEFFTRFVSYVNLIFKYKKFLTLSCHNNFKAYFAHELQPITPVYAQHTPHQMVKMLYDVMKKQENKQKKVPHYANQGILFLSFD
jgi:hypothetical protein